MPAGNDASAAASELADQFALGQAKAEDLRTINRQRYPHELRTAQLAERDDEKSEELDWAKAAEAVGVDEQDVIDAAVRGTSVVVVYEDARGEAHKKVCDAEDAGVEVRRVGGAARRKAAAQSEDPGSDDTAKPKAKPKRSRSRAKKKS